MSRISSTDIDSLRDVRADLSKQLAAACADRKRARRLTRKEAVAAGHQTLTSALERSLSYSTCCAPSMLLVLLNTFFFGRRSNAVVGLTSQPSTPRLLKTCSWICLTGKFPSLWIRWIVVVRKTLGVRRVIILLANKGLDLGTTPTRGCGAANSSSSGCPVYWSSSDARGSRSGRAS